MKKTTLHPSRRDTRRDSRATDAALRSLFDHDMPQAVSDPQFTRKVLNRLPDRRLKGVRWVVIFLYALAIAACIYIWVNLAPDFFGSRALTVRTTLQYFVTVGILGAVTLLCIIPWAPRRE